MVETPKIVEEGGEKYLRGAFEGLYTGNEYEIAIWCVLDNKSAGTDGYTYWDGTAYAQDKAASAASNVYRLWWKEGQTPVPPDPVGQYRLTYAFTGTVPPDASVPQGGVYSESERPR